MSTKITFEVRVEGNTYPKTCAECPAFSQVPYRCHNEAGYEARCMLGYMGGHDMRDFSGRTRFPLCRLENDPRVSIREGAGE